MPFYLQKVGLLAKLNKKVERAEKRVNDKKMRVLELIDGEKNYIKKIDNYI